MKQKPHTVNDQLVAAATIILVPKIDVDTI